jgi:hypothetical protein
MNGIGTPAIPSTGGGGVASSVTVTNFPATQPVSGTVTANQGTANATPWNENITQVKGVAISTGGGSVDSGTLRVFLAYDQSVVPVAGAIGSGGANSGNPLKIGSVFNTTQPTVTNGQIVDQQSTARGALIVGTGVDTFNATINAALPAGTNLIGKVGIDQTTPGTTNGIVAKDASNTAIFGTAAAMADSTANPTLGSNQAYLMAFNGSTWDRLHDLFLTSDGQGVQTGLFTLPQNLVFNGSTWDRMRGNTTATFAQGTVATNVAITANPMNLGAQAVSSENAAVTTARQVQLVADLVGKLIVLPYANPENFVSGAITSAMTGTTSTSLIAAPASGLRNYITQITVSNAHATVGTDMIVQDGSGGTTLYTIPAAAVYGGAAITFPTPLRQPTTATAIFIANVTTGASTKASASGYKGI